MRPNLPFRVVQNFIVASSRFVPDSLVFQFPVDLRGPIIVVPSDLINSVHVKMLRKYRSKCGRLDADVFVAARMPWVSLRSQRSVMFRVLFEELSGGGESVDQKTCSSGPICMRQQMEELKSCGIREVGIVRVST